jgi:hypothetical protein
MSEDPRCCGSGTCIIDTQGRCWCGQQWDGEKMCHVPLAALKDPGPAAAIEPVSAPASDSGPAANRKL